MTQYQIKLLYQPEPSSREIHIKMACKAHARARDWAEQARAAGLEDVLLPRDRPALHDLVGRARRRQLLSEDGRDSVVDAAAACAARIACMVNLESGRARAATLTAHELELHALAADIDAVLDLEHALKARHGLRN